jgi:hypothetical protein
MYQYSFANVDLILKVPNESGAVKPLTVKGYGTGENLISIMRKAPIAATQFGAYGDMVLSMQRIKAGDLVFTVLMNSPENTVLQNYANHFQELAFDSTQLVVPIQAMLKDNMGKDECLLVNGVILAMPAMSRGQTMNTVTWVITFEKVEFTREAGKDSQAISGSF